MIQGENLLQDQDSLAPEEITFTCVSEAQPTEELMRDLRFAWRCVKHIKSNAIAIAKGEKLLGMGAGQPNRVKSTDIALERVRCISYKSCTKKITARDSSKSLRTLSCSL